MNLISCSGCGVVLDGDKLLFSKDLYMKDGDGDWIIDTDVAAWNGETYVPTVPCPVCKGEILSDG